MLQTEEDAGSAKEAEGGRTLVQRLGGPGWGEAIAFFWRLGFQGRIAQAFKAV